MGDDMGKMKESYFDILEYAEYCCDNSKSMDEARAYFELLFPDDEEIFRQAWSEWMIFSEHILQLGVIED